MLLFSLSIPWTLGAVFIILTGVIALMINERDN